MWPFKTGDITIQWFSKTDHTVVLILIRLRLFLVHVIPDLSGDLDMKGIILNHKVICPIMLIPDLFLMLYNLSIV